MQKKNVQSTFFFKERVKGFIPCGVEGAEPLMGVGNAHGLKF